MVKKIATPRAARAKATPPPADAPARILEAARAEFSAKGFGGARMQAIAKAADVNHALVHYYFRSKEGLYEAALRDILQTMWGGLRAELQKVPVEAAFGELLRTFLQTHARILARNPGFLPFLLRELMDEGRVLPAALGGILEHFGEVPARINAGLLGEIAAGRMRPVTPVNFWMNVVGMAAGGLLGSHVLRRNGFALAAGVTFDEAFFLARADMIATVLIRGLGTGKESA